MAAVKSHSGPGAMQAATGRKKGDLVRQCVQKNTASSVYLPYRSPESVEMDEIMAAMVLTSLSCSPVIPRPTQREPIPHDPLDVECGGGELSDSGSSGYWSWKHGSISASQSQSVSVGEQWLQRNRVPTISTSPSRGHCSIRKGRGEAKKCRKVYGVERRDQWCTACRWKKACQRFPD